MKFAQATTVNPPPVLDAVTWAPFLVEKTPNRDVELRIEILEDVDVYHTGAAVTETKVPDPERTHYVTDAHGKIESYTFVWKGSFTVQRKFTTDNRPETHDSAYGRGTGDDVKNGNVTVGFHEWCHANDSIAYIGKSVEVDLTGSTTAYVLPESNPGVTVRWTYKKFPRFDGDVGQSESKFRTAMEAFDRELRHWRADHDKFLEACTHEVYYPLSKCRREHPELFRTAPRRDRH